MHWKSRALADDPMANRCARRQLLGLRSRRSGEAGQRAPQLPILGTAKAAASLPFLRATRCPSERNGQYADLHELLLRKIRPNLWRPGERESSPYSRVL